MILNIFTISQYWQFLLSVGFIIYMVEKLQVENPANAPMHYGYKDAVGVLQAPDKIPSTTLYSYAEGKKYYNKLDYDVYVEQKKSTPKRKGTPLGIKILLGIGVLFCGFKLIKNAFTKLRH